MCVCPPVAEWLLLWSAYQRGCLWPQKQIVNMSLLALSPITSVHLLMALKGYQSITTSITCACICTWICHLYLGVLITISICSCAAGSPKRSLLSLLQPTSAPVRGIQNMVDHALSGTIKSSLPSLKGGQREVKMKTCQPLPWSQMSCTNT